MCLSEIFDHGRNRSLPEKPETIPGETYVLSVRDQVLVEILRRLETELAHPLSVVVDVYRDGRPVSTVGPIATGKGEAQRGEVRVRFRSTAVPRRFLFFADAVFETDARTPTFSGFFVRGDVQQNDETTKANFSTWVVKREDRQWMKWL